MAFENIIVDYALPLIEMERRLKKIHELCTDKKFSETTPLLAECIADIHSLQAVVAILGEKESK